MRFSGFAVTSLSRSSVDAAGWSRDVLTAHRIFVSVVQQLGVRPGKLLEDLEAAGKVRHRQTLRRLLVDLEGGAQALSEVAFLPPRVLSTAWLPSGAAAGPTRCGRSPPLPGRDLPPEGRLRVS